MADLLEQGRNRLEWARGHMPVLAAIRADLAKRKPLKGLRVGMALHVEAKTGVLAFALRDAGAHVRLASCNPLSTDDAVVAALRDGGLDVHAKKWETEKEYDEYLQKVLDLEPNVVIDDGADLIYRLHTGRQVSNACATAVDDNPAGGFAADQSRRSWPDQTRGG